jgi:carbon monoxide dehydrogenase subunit G
MKIEGAHTLPASRDKVYAMLLDPGVLQRLIPGCDEIQPQGEGVFRLKMRAGIAAIRGHVEGEIRVAEQRPPEHYRLAMSGKGMGSFVNGWASIDLTEAAAGAEVRYQGEANVGGMIAAVGSRMIELAVRKALADFFGKLQQELRSGD